ncbi:hypothetical protein B0H14DRAFT_3649089 [Mycena olivaceomarginata]|nr:hypothetical protein B0H14DRAFT_3649089 [Mycena olivaceomarginata]
MVNRSDAFKSQSRVSTNFHLPLALIAPRVAPAKPVTGPPQALISRIEHLADLLHNLPSSLPEKPSHSLYNFWTDLEILKDGGHFSAVSHALEVSFETHLLGLQGRTLVFTERGERLDTLVKFLKTGVKHMSPGERTTFQGAWLERLITAAVDSGAKIRSKKRKAPVAASATHENLPATKKSKPAAVITIDDDSESENPHPISPPSLPPTSITPSTSAQPSASKHTVVGNPKQVTLGAFGWKKAEPGEVSAYWAKAKDSGAHRREQVLAAQKQKAEDQQQRERDLALTQGSQPIPDVASLSRPATQGWKEHRNGTRGGAVQGQAKKVFWFDPFLWALIEPTIRRCGWSAEKTVQALWRAHPVLFNQPGNTLHRATVWMWFVKGEKRFTESALRNIASPRSLAGTGRTGILTPYPEIVDEIVKTFKGLRVAGCVVNVHIARSLMIAIIGKRRPQLLESFSCSQNYVRSFLDSTLNWTSFFRLAHAIEHQDIPAKVSSTA